GLHGAAAGGAVRVPAGRRRGQSAEAGRVAPRGAVSQITGRAACDTLSKSTWRIHLKRKTLSVIIAIAAAVTLAAQEKKDAPKKGAAKGAILHPELAVEQGSYDKPMATIGTKPSQAWTNTTVAAGVDSKPQPGSPITVVGEIIDLSCYVQLGKHGEKHRSGGQKCGQTGQPIGLLTRDGSIYMLMPEEHDPRRDGGVDAKPSASDHMGHIVEVSGTSASVGAYKAIFVQGLTK